MSFLKEDTNAVKINYYGSLCTEMYEILHEKAPQDELDFYLSYAEKGKKIMEALCGSGRFLVPFMERGFDIFGVDLSEEMLAKLREKKPGAKAAQGDILEYDYGGLFDYIFISSSSVSLFTDMELCGKILSKMKATLMPGGKLVFAVDTVSERCPDDDDYRVSVSVRTKENFELVLKTRNYYDEQTQTQFSPGIYELYDGERLLQREVMDFQTHLYRYGEMERLLKGIGFSDIKTYSSFSKEIAADDQCASFLFECSTL